MPLDGSLPDLRGQLVALVSGMITLDQFVDWFLTHMKRIEFEGSDDDVSLLNRVFHIYAEYTSDYIDASGFVDALRTDALVQRELQVRRAAAV
jgi:hypothetical protein